MIVIPIMHSDSRVGSYESTSSSLMVIEKMQKVKNIVKYGDIPRQ